MDELVTVEQAGRAIAVLAIVLPAAGLVAGAAIGASRRALGPGALQGILWGLVGPAIWLLWRMYNSVVGVYGLDSVRGLLVNLALFVVIGVVLGLGIGLLRRRLGGGSGETASTRGE